MKIAGIQKMTLIDYPGKIACTFFIFGCNFKCGYCHNPELVIEKDNINDYSIGECLDFLKRKRKYLDGVCITGGEPLINPDIKDFLFKIKRMGYLIKIDTNGSNPDLLEEIILKGLVNYVAMDIKYDKSGYCKLIGVRFNLNFIEKSIKVILNSGIDYEFRTTLIPGFHDSKVLDNIGKWLYKNSKVKIKKYVLQNFVPRKGKMIDKDFQDNGSFSYEELVNMKYLCRDYFEVIEIRG